MSHTSPRPRRLVTGLAVIAAAAATTLLGAAPASAATVATARVTAGNMIVVGSDFGDSITASGGNSTIDVSNTLGSITAGTGCVQLGAVVRCSGVNAIAFSGLGGDDTFRNNTSLPGNLRGGNGNDRLTGGSGDDRISGNLGTDFAFGLGGFDTCIAENESGCEA